MVKTIGIKKVKVSEVVFHQEFYPREKPRTATIENYVDALRAGNVFPPIELDQDGLVLLDGYHRWKAHQEAGIAEIEAKIVDLDGLPRKLYALGMNCAHGICATNKEKKDTVRDMAEAGVKLSIILEWVKGVSERTLYSWISDILGKKQRRRDAQIWWLQQLGWTQEEIGGRMDASQKTISNSLVKTAELQKLLKDQTSRGRTPEQIAEAEDLSRELVEVLLLDGKSDVERMEWLKVGIQPYDVWTFSGCDPRFGGEYPGRIPGQILLNLLYFYTDQGDLVVDPMVGSGTAIDACAFMGRKIYGYDAHSNGREDVIEHDLASGWPERTSQAKLIFWDPPYFKKKDDGYGEKSISRLGRKEYLEFFADLSQQIPSKFSGKLAFLCSDFNEEELPDQNIFFWDYINLFTQNGWMPERRIQIPLSTQQIHPDIVNRFRKEKRLARLNRDLVVMKKCY